MDEQSPFVRHRLQALRKRQRLILPSLAFIPALWFALLMFDESPHRTFWGILAWACIAGLAAPHLVLNFDACPRCRGTFFARSTPLSFGWPYYPLASRCQNCGLELPPRD